METKHTHTVVPVTAQTSSIENTIPLPTDTMKAEVMMALNTLDAIYKENIKSYAQTLHTYSCQIDDAKSQLDALNKEITPHKAILIETEKEIDYEMRTLERFTQEWSEISLVIEALKVELDQLNHSEDERENVVKSRYETLKILQKNIDDTELRLLEHALEKQNIVLLIEPIEREIHALELRMKQLESKKRYIETAHLHQISPQGNRPTQAELENKSEIIDI